MAKAKKRSEKILLFPGDTWIRAGRKKLPKFKPHDLRALIHAAKKNGEENINTAFLLEFRRRNEKQLIELLRSLGVDSSKPNAWALGFLMLAVYHHGASHLAWFPVRTNRNAASWTPEHDLNLLREVTISQGRGLSQRQAVKLLAADRTKWELFPYRPKGHFSTGSEQKKREAALWAHLRAILEKSRGRSLLDLFGGLQQPDTGTIEDTLHRFDWVNSFPTLVKNENLFEKGDS